MRRGDTDGVSHLDHPPWSLDVPERRLDRHPVFCVRARIEAAMSLSAIVCAYNEERTLPAALHSLFAQTRVPDEVIVVNNASTDRTRKVAAAFPGVTVVDEPEKG